MNKTARIFLSLVLLFACTVGTVFANITNNGINTGTQTQNDNTNTANGGSVSGNILTGGTSVATGGTSTSTGGAVLASGNSTSNSGGNTQSNAGNNADTDVNVSSEHNEKHVRGEGLSYGAPSYQAAKGVSTSQMGSILGSITLSDSEGQEVQATATEVVTKLVYSDLIKKEEGTAFAKKILTNLEFAARPKRFLGFGWKTQGKSLENLFGLLAWTSFRGND